MARSVTSLTKAKKIYFIGIKGVGMTMLAQFLAATGHQVSGSDVTDTFLTDRVLAQAKIKIFSPFQATNIPIDADLIIYSSAYNVHSNLELAYIKSHPAVFKKIPLLSYAEALGQTFNNYYGLAVCGTHGKTTTTAWLGYVLWRAGLKPNVLVGSSVPQFHGSSLLGQSKYFVAEADEYQNKLQYFQPRAVVLNNIDYDHPDFFKTKAAYVKVFADFIQKIPVTGFLIINQRDVASKKLRTTCRGRVISYDLVVGSYGGGADYLAYDWQIKTGQQIFSVSYRGKQLGRFKIKLLGEHSILNALAVIAAARELKVPLELIRKHLAGFTGTARRTQVLGKYQGALIIDDYAHHPTEIKSTLAGLRQFYPQHKLVVVFHPHTFTRTKALFNDFATSFSQADEVIVLDIYGSAREQQGGVSSQELVQAIKAVNQANLVRQQVRRLATISLAAAYLRKHLGAGQLVVLMGAGDVFRVYDELKKTTKA
jgi:UDP-N-acetylmuramate--alanine ligase